MDKLKAAWAGLPLGLKIVVGFIAFGVLVSIFGG